jgi:hypothetical protein
MITYSATLDVPRALAQHVAHLLLVERAHRGTRRGRRALGVFSHAVLVLRWFREATGVQIPARDNGTGISTCYRYLHEAITVLAEQASELPDVLRERLAAGDTHVLLDGTLIRSDRLATTTENEKGKTINLWYSGKHKAFGGNVQFLATADGFPLWCSDVSPGSNHDLATAREHGAIAALCAAATKGLPCLADKGYCFAGIGIYAPIKNPAGDQVLDADNRCHNSLLTRLRCLGERAAATLLTRWKTLRRITLCPWRIGPIAKAALVLTQFEHQGRYRRVGSWRGGMAPARQSVHAVLPHTAYRRHSPPAFGLSRQGLPALGETTIPYKPIRPNSLGVKVSRPLHPKFRLRRWRLLTNNAIRIRTYCLSLLKRSAECPYLKYPTQPRRNSLMSCTTASTESSSLRWAVSSRTRSRACCIALSAGQQARKVTGRFPSRDRDLTNRW